MEVLKEVKQMTRSLLKMAFCVSLQSNVSDAMYGDPTVIDGDLVIQMTDASWTCFERSLA